MLELKCLVGLHNVSIYMQFDHQLLTIYALLIHTSH